MSLSNGNGSNPSSLLTRRFTGIDLAGVRVRKAVTESDFEIVASLREAGFSRIAPSSESNGGAAQWVDALDRSPGVFCLIGYGQTGEPVSTMRVQDGLASALELARFVPLDDLLLPEQRPAAQFARLSVIKGSQSTNAMFGVFKAAWKWCLLQGISSIVITTPPWSRHLYDFMFFDDLGNRGHFSHQYAGGAPHATMRLPVAGAEGILRSRASPLCEQFFDLAHPGIEIT